MKKNEDAFWEISRNPNLRRKKEVFMKAQGEISALLRFDQNGQLKNISLIARGEEDQRILQKALSAFLKPTKFSLMKTLLGKE